MEKLIAEINALGHNVQLYQYGTWLINTAGRWEATATNIDGKVQTGFSFGQTPIEALTKLRDKIKGWKSAAVKDPFEDDLSDALDKEFPDLKADPFEDDEESAFE